MILCPSFKKQCQQLEGGDFLDSLRASWLLSHFLSCFLRDYCHNFGAAETRGNSNDVLVNTDLLICRPKVKFVLNVVENLFIPLGFMTVFLFFS